MKTVLRHTWGNMLDRCNRPTFVQYSDYGGRGIQVCKRWQKLENFVLDMGDKPHSNWQLCRRDVNGNYDPQNCFWGPRNATSRRPYGSLRKPGRWQVTVLTLNGVTQTVKEWANQLGFKNPDSILRRMEYLGMSVEQALTPPQRRGRKAGTKNKPKG